MVQVHEFLCAIHHRCRTQSLHVPVFQELPAKRAAAIVADHTGLRKNLLYDYLVEHKTR